MLSPEGLKTFVLPYRNLSPKFQLEARGTKSIVYSQYSHRENKVHTHEQWAIVIKACVPVSKHLPVLKVKSIYLTSVVPSFLPSSYETGINGSRRCALNPPPSVIAPFKGY